MAADGLITMASSLGAKETMDRLEAEVKAKGLTVFARIDHAAGAVEVGLPLRPTEVLIFGNAKGGTPLMQANQAIGIDLPLKALVFEDAAGKVRSGMDSAAPSGPPSMPWLPRSTPLRPRPRNHPEAAGLHDERGAS